MNLNWIGCFRKTLAACFAFASEFGRFWCAFVFLDVCDHIFVSLVFQQPMGSFSEKLCVLHFSEAACLYNNFVDKMDVFGIYQNFVMSLKLRRWIQHMYNLNGMDENSFLFFPCHCQDDKRDATQCMLHDKQTRCFASFSCVEKNWVLVQWQPLFWEVFWFKHSTWWGRPNNASASDSWLQLGRVGFSHKSDKAGQTN